MGFQDVAFLPSRASFSTTFLRNHGRSESIRTTACLISVGSGNQGYAHCKIFPLQQSVFFMSVKVHGDHTADTRMR